MKQEKTLTSSHILLLVIAVVITAAFAVTAVVLGHFRETPAKGLIKAEELNAVKIRYSPETEAEFRLSIESYLKRLLGGLLDEISINTTWLGSDLILAALQNADIGADKVQNIAAYLRTVSPDEDSVLGFLEDILMDDGNGNAVLNPNVDIISSFAAHFNVFNILNDIVLHAGLTSYDVGAFLFEHQLLASDSERQALLRALGRKNYTALFADTLEVSRIFSVFLTSSAVTPAEGGMMKELLFELGSRYIRVLDEFGEDNLETLFGVGSEFIPPNKVPPQDAFKAEILNQMSLTLKGLTGYLIFAAGETMRALPQNLFTCLVNAAEGNEKDKLFASFYAAQSLHAANRAALLRYGFTETDVILKFSEFAALCLALENNSTEGLTENQAAEAAAFSKILAELEEFSALNVLTDINDGNYEEMKEKMDEFLGGWTRLENGLRVAQGLFLYGMFLNMLFPQGF